MTKKFLAALYFSTTSAIGLVSESQSAVQAQNNCNCGSECNASADLNLVLGGAEGFTSDFCISTAQYFACCTNACGVQCDCNNGQGLRAINCCNSENVVQLYDDIDVDYQTQFLDYVNFPAVDCPVTLKFENHDGHDDDEATHQIRYYADDRLTVIIEELEPDGTFTLEYKLGWPMLVGELDSAVDFDSEVIVIVGCIEPGKYFEFDQEGEWEFLDL